MAGGRCHHLASVRRSVATASRELELSSKRSELDRAALGTGDVLGVVQFGNYLHRRVS